LVCNHKIEKYSNNWDHWDYPHVDRDRYKREKERDLMPSWIGSWYDYDVKGLRQHWRFYRNGQFVHLRSFLEEDESRRQKAKERTGTINIEVPGYIATETIVFTTTKIFWFAARLALNFNGSVFIKIQMKGIKEFILYEREGAPGVIGSRPMITDTDPYKVKTETQALFNANATDEFARKAADLIFQHFKANITEETLKWIQSKLKRELT